MAPRIEKQRVERAGAKTTECAPDGRGRYVRAPARRPCQRRSGELKALSLALLLGVPLMQGCQADAARQAPASGAATEESGGAGGAAGNASAESASAETSSSAGGAGENAPAEGSPAERESFAQWLDEFTAYAQRQGIASATLESALSDLAYQPRIIELDRYQPEFTRAIWTYLDSAVSDTRIENGREKLAAHRASAERAEMRYGVPPAILTAIWGVESNYGSNFGSFRTLEALATLGYEGRRHEFAREQLLAALRIIEQGDIAPEEMRGSWAGAMGHTQFIPTSFLAYAVDGDGDGRRDIWGSIDDVMASTAHYLEANGWRRGERWGMEVQLPADFDYALTGLATRDASAEWRARGVRSASGEPLASLEGASVIAPAGARGPAFLVGHNFRVIMRYNNATSYALAVALLADRIDGQPGVAAEWPRDLEPLSRSQTRELQQALNRLGFDAGTPDGIMGPNTRSALRLWQRDRGETPDGFASVELLERLQRQ